jgi:uncharacterized protein involved in oxidation of intracellular sulfur
MALAPAAPHTIMKVLLILNDPPYGTERSYNALRLAGSLVKAAGEELRVFMLGDAASCAKSGQKVPEGFYNIQLMLNRVTRSGGKVGVCGTCMEARGISEAELIEGTRKSTLAELSSWTQWADKVLVF